MAFHSSTTLHALAWRASRSQNAELLRSLAWAATRSANWLCMNPHSSMGEEAELTGWWAATLVIWTLHPPSTSSAISIHKSALGELMRTGAPRKIRRRRKRRTTAWQSDQIINCTPRQLANLTALTIAYSSARWMSDGFLARDHYHPLSRITAGRHINGSASTSAYAAYRKSG